MLSNPESAKCSASFTVDTVMRLLVPFVIISPSSLNYQIMVNHIQKIKTFKSNPSIF